MLCWLRGALAQSLRTAIPASGTLNRTLLIETSCGRYVLRAYRHHERLPVEREHAIIAYAREHDALAIAPLPLPDGNTVLERDGRFYALFHTRRGSRSGATP